MYLRVIIISSFLSLSQCSNSQNKLTFEAISYLNRTDTIKTNHKNTINKQEYFIIDNFQDNATSESSIDQFVRTIVKDSAKVENYSVYFFKKSTKTNLENLRSNPRDLARYSQQNDLIYEYSWSKGNFIGRYKFKDGVIISPEGDIQVEDVKIE